MTIKMQHVAEAAAWHRARRTLSFERLVFDNTRVGTVPLGLIILAFGQSVESPVTLSRLAHHQDAVDQF